MAEFHPKEMDLRLLRKEIEVQGELLAREQLERRIEVDRLKLEVLALKNTLDTLSPGFLRTFEKIYDEERSKFDPESEKLVGKSA